MANLLLLILAVSGALAQRPVDPSTNVPCAVCTVSGDPHYKTFDDLHHDFQGNGVFQLASNSIISVQSQMQPCFKNFITCVRSTSVRIVDSPGSQRSLTISYGGWHLNKLPDQLYIKETYPANPRSGDPARSTEDRIDANTLPATGRQVLDGMYLLNFQNGRVNLVPNNFVAMHQIRVALGVHYVAISMPKVATYMFGATNGLCGLFDGEQKADFTTYNGTSLNLNYAVKRHNGPDVNNWGLSFAVDNVNIKPNLNHYYDLQNRLTEFSVAPLDATAPTDSDTAKVLNVGFDTLQDAEAATRFCAKALDLEVTEGTEHVPFQNCVMDAQVNNLLANSNAEAVRAQNEMQPTSNDSSSGLSQGGLIAIIVVACVAGVALLAAGILAFHNRRLRVECDNLNAIIIRQPNAGDNYVNGGVNLSEQL
eukprot:TRINITY_DN1709_c0_g1_i1.p1 TRINITY_DN1709_c0_g1~~TRINITY_DN1709_c0_g1_i1.p1  ORF type:complete len:423 (+),score=168.64 TRINITY_DN1709_c0_g1_i1:58-1326(+)